MNFGEKLELLMNMTNTTNNEIATALEIDPSLISRFRTGKRVPSATSGYRERIAGFIASKATQEYQKVALLELTDRVKEDSVDEIEFFTSILTSYLEDSTSITQKEVSHFISTLSSYSGAHLPPISIEGLEEKEGLTVEQQLYKGPNGCREAVIKLLKKAIEENRETTLRLYSDESMLWITEIPKFNKIWTLLLSKCIQRGIHIEIIHTLQRNSTEMNTALTKWFPFYLSGAITSYYFPLKYEKLFNHTIFLVNDTYAVYSQSLPEQDREEISYYYAENHSVISSLSSSFNSLLLQAKPLVFPYSNPTVENYLDLLSRAFEKGEKSSIGLESLFSLAMSDSLLKKVLERNEVAPEIVKEAVEMQKRSNEVIASYLQEKSLTLITTLPRITEVLKGAKDCILPPLGRSIKMKYLPSEFKEHLEYLIQMLKKHPHLHIFIVPHQRFSFGVQTLCIDNSSLLVLKQTSPSFLFASEQKELVTSMRGYIKNIATTIPKRHRKKEYIISRLTQYIEKIESGETN